MPFGLDNPQVIFVVVMVFILFVNKVVTLIKENAASKRRGRGEIEWKDVPHLPGQRPATDRTPSPIPLPQTRRDERRRSTFEEVLSDLFETAAKPVQPREQTANPAPAKAPPAFLRIPLAPRLTKEEQDALVRLERRKVVPTLTRKETVGGTGVARLLRTRDATRDAIVAAEILGPPRALRPLERRY